MADQECNLEFQRIFRTSEVDTSRGMMEMTWYRNILYFIGEQWLSWYAETGKFGRRYELNTFIPTPVSNIIRDTLISLKALTLNKRYATRIWPNSEELQDQDAAWLGEQLLRHMDTEHNNRTADIMEIIEQCRLLTGNAFCRVDADNELSGYIKNPTTGEVVTPKGDVRLSLILPFNIYVPREGMFLDEKRYLGIVSTKPKEWVEDTYKVLINQTDADKRLVEYERELHSMIANVSPWKGRGPSSETIDEDQPGHEMVVVREVQYRPTRQRPTGRHVIMCGEDVLSDKDDLPIPTDTKTGRWCYDVTHFPYNNVTGTFWATGAVDDLVSPQNSINEIDQSLSINRQSLGRPWVLTPSELVVRRISSRSQALLAVQYDSRTALGAKPEIHPGVPYPQQILEERNIHKGVAQDAAGDPKNILRGQSPHSGASGVMVDILREAAEASHGPNVARFYRNRQEVDKKRLILAQHLYTESRYIKISGEGNKVYVKAFRGADLRGNTDIRLELDSAGPTTHAGRNELISRLVQGNFFGDITMKPRLQRYVLKTMGLNNVPDEENLHRDKAEWENSVLANGSQKDLLKISYPSSTIPDEQGQPLLDPTGQPVRLFPPSYDPTFRFDNHAVHLQILEQLIFSRQFRDLEEFRQELAIAHYDMHAETLKILEEEQAARLAEQAAAGVLDKGGGPVTPPQSDIPATGVPPQDTGGMAQM